MMFSGQLCLHKGGKGFHAVSSHHELLYEING